MNWIANNIRSLTFALSFTALAGVIGCDAGPDADAPQEATETTTAALIKGGIEVGGFTCDDGARTCTCVGDAACDEMFGSGLCGSKASCDTSNPSQPVCTCEQAMRVRKGRFDAVKIDMAVPLSLAR